jgi:hypothetical protein
MAILNPQTIAPTGTTITFVAAAAGGDSFQNNGYQKVHFKNTTGAPITVNVDTPNPDNFGVVNNALDITVTVPANAVNFTAGPFRTDRHNDANGRVQLTYPGGVTGLTVAVTNN